MDIRKHNSDENFEIIPETQAEVDLALARLDLVSSIGQSIKHHREAQRRLEARLAGEGGNRLRPPEGHLFVVESLDGFSEPRFHISKFVPGRDYYWDRIEEVTSERGQVFLANHISADTTFSDNPGVVYAYGQGDALKTSLRCSLDRGRYKISLSSTDHLPEQVLNLLPVNGTA